MRIVRLFLFGAAIAACGRAEAQGQIPFAASTPGICLFSRAEAIGTSLAGQAGTQRMQQLAAAVNVELASQRQALVQEREALQTAQSPKPGGTSQPRLIDFQQGLQRFDRLQQLRNAQLTRTRQLVEQAIANYIAPSLAPVISARHCSILFDRNSTYGWNPAMDLTPQVIQELNQRVPRLDINLVNPNEVQVQR